MTYTYVSFTHRLAAARRTRNVKHTLVVLYYLGQHLLYENNPQLGTCDLDFKEK